jgi:large repetitive protein
MNLVLQIILLVFFTIACQVKEASQDGELISNHVPTTNSFTQQDPLSATYVTGNTINFAVTFPYEVAIDSTSGYPRLKLTVGSTTRYATYVSGDGLKTLTFSYVVVGADNDTDGVTVNALEANGSLMTFDFNGVLTTCNAATVTTKTYAQVLVDNAGPTISSMALSTIPGFYHVGDVLHFTATFSESVIVTGSPRIQMVFTTPGAGTPQYATYASGSGTTTLVFNYTIPNTAADTNGFDSVVSPVQLNSGTIKDPSGNDATLTYSNTAVLSSSALVLFDGRVPYVTAVTPPANGTYVAAQNLDFTLTFNRPVNITGAPYIEITIGGTLRQAAYVSSPTTSTALFRYSTVPGDIAPSGISIATSITQNSSTIAGVASPTNSYFTTGNNLFTVPVTTGVIVNAVQPMPTSVTRNIDSTLPIWGGSSADNTWIIGQTLLVSVGFNTPVFVGQTGGSPRIAMTIGSTTKYATYLSGGNGQSTLVFTYTVVEGDLDTDTNIGLTAIELNGGTITDAANTNSLLTFPSPNLTNTKIDGVKPLILSVTGPPAGTYSTVTGNNNSNMPFSVTWSEAVNYSSAVSYLPLTIGSTANNATYASGTNTASSIYRPTTLLGLNDSDGITMASPMTGSAVIKDQAGNAASVLTFTPPSLTTVLVDTTNPTVTSISAPSSRYYVAAENLDFLVTFSEPVTVNVAAGYPSINLTIGSTLVTLIPTASGTATTHTYRYQVVANMSDTDGVTIANTMNVSAGGYVRDAGQNLLSTATFTLPTLTGVLVDSTLPTITSVSAPASGVYGTGSNLNFTINYSEIMTVSGTPRILATAQTGTVYFNYLSGTGTTALTFRLTSATEDLDLDGLSPSTVNTIDLNGGSIVDAVSNPSPTTFSAQTISGIKLIFSNVTLWTDSSLTSLYAGSGVTVSSAGAVTTTTCGTGTCRVFSGDDSLSLTTPVSSVKYVYLAYKAPASVTNQNMIDSDITLAWYFGSFQYDGVSSTYNHNGSAGFSGTFSASSFNILETVYGTAQSYSAGVLIPTSFGGGIGEVLMITGALTTTQRSSLLLYLNNKY